MSALAKLGLLVVAFCFGLGLGLRNPQVTDLTFLAVGQGDCTVFRHNGYTILIDAGPKLGRQDAGARIIVPALREMNTTKIDLILLSHPDIDHIGGLPAISRAFRIGHVAIPKDFEHHAELREVLKVSRIRPDQIIWLPSKMEAQVGEFLLESDSMPWGPDVSDNDGSMFVRLSNGRASFTTSGDASEAAELMISSQGDWSAQIMHVGHHGSGSSTSYAWIKEVRPGLAIVSCGRDNMYGHPAPDTLKRLADFGVPTLRTDRAGTLRFELSDGVFVRRP